MFSSRLKHLVHVTAVALLTLSLLFTQTGYAYAEKSDDSLDLQVNSYAVVFVSRKIPSNGSIYMSPSETGSQPGVGAYSRFQVAAPGKLLVRETNGTLRTLIDGSKPSQVSLNLIDVNAPDVSYDGQKIVFAGLVAGSYPTEPLRNPGAWRLYVINADGTGLRQLTFSDRDNLDLSQFRNVGENFKKYDDADPVWLPDGRIVFSSTRWPSFAQYSGSRTSNLYVVNADGTNMHRITAERNGADRPLVDPVTGRIVYSRWWRNFRYAVNSMDTVYWDPADPSKGYKLHNGLSSDRDQQVVRPDYLSRNFWHPISINPDGTDMTLWSGGGFETAMSNQVYGGVFTAEGALIANFFPMVNMSEAAGFGGLRRYERGPHRYQPVMGVTERNDSKNTLVRYNPPSYAIYQSQYVTEPEILPDGRLIVSVARDIAQDYGLYTANIDGTGLTLLYDNPGTTELRARVLRPRPLPPIIRDRVTKVASLLPPLEQGPYDVDGSYTFDALNVYFNAPVDTDILNAMPVGSANTIRFFIDHQRWQQKGSFEGLDWPILLKEMPVNADGSVQSSAPANVPVFEQIRSTKPGYTVPLTGNNAPSPEHGGAAHVAGMNFGRPGEVVRCVGCHAGHSMIPVPSNPEDAKWTNLAPGATVTFSSLSSSLSNGNGLIDRRVNMSLPSKHLKYWVSNAGTDPATQWVQLTFPVPISVRTVRLYNIPSVDSAVQVQAATVKLFSDTGATNLVGSNTSGALTSKGTDVSFTDVTAQVVRVEFNSVSGGDAALAEVEVIARAGGGTTSPPMTVVPTGTATTATATYTSTPTAVNATTATSTYTFTPTAVNARTATPAYTFTTTPINSPQPTFTSVVPSTIPPTTTPFPTFTALPTRTSTVLPTSNPNTAILPVVSLTTEIGSTKGSYASLATLKLSGTQNDPKEYVMFQQQNGKYSGYFSYTIPAGIQPSPNTEASLLVNFGATAVTEEKWKWSIYDWSTKAWVPIGELTVKGQTSWKTLNFKIQRLRQYASAENEVRIQLRTDNSSTGAVIDYQVIQLTNLNLSVQSQNIVPVIPTWTPSVAPTTIILSLTVIPSDTPTAIPPTP